jgi:hypothetical protein
MFELHLGDGLTVKADYLSSPLVILGNVGQGKSSLLMHLALILIHHQQPGVLYDPYGDLTKKVQQYIQSEQARSFVKVISHTDAIQQDTLFNKFVFIQGNKFTDGAAATRAQAQQILKSVYQLAQPNSWVIIDEGFEVLNDELFQHYLNTPQYKTLLSDTTFVTLSAQQREQLCSTTKQFVIYKSRNIDGKMFEQRFPNIKAKDIAAIQQYHFYWIDSGIGRYIQAPWPLLVV